MRSCVVFGIWISLFLCVACERTNEPPLAVEEYTIDELNQLGWSNFQNAKYADALSYFNKTLFRDSSNMTAMVGKGWSLLLQDGEGFDSSEYYLQKGVHDATWKSDARCGLVVFRFLREQYTEIEALVDMILADQPDYFFEQKPSIDWHDLLLIKAQAYFYTDEYTNAWETIQQITSVFTLDPDDYRTWVINNVAYFSFEAALTKAIEILSELYRE